MTGDDEELRSAVVAYVILQRRLVHLLQAPGADPAGLAAAMTAELDQLAAAMEITGWDPGPRYRSDPGA